MEPILAILPVVTKRALRGRKKMDRLHIRACSFDAAVTGKIRKHLYAPHHVPAPALARLIYLRISDAILLQKAHRQLAGKLISRFFPSGKLDEVLPNCSISIA